MVIPNITVGADFYANNPLIQKTTEISVKEMCYGMVGIKALLLCIFMLGFNFVAFMLWKHYYDKKFKLFGKEFYIVYFIPVINACAFVIFGMFIYNMF